MRDNWTSARLLYRASGSPTCPKPSEPTDSRCYLCGLPCGGVGVPRSEACPATFTDHDDATWLTSQHVCVPCAWAYAGRPPDTLRMWTIIYREDRDAGPSNQKAPRIRHAQLIGRDALVHVADALLSPPSGLWFCSVARTGKVHTLPYAPTNYRPSPWSVRFERCTVASTPAEFGHVLHHVASLRSLGLSQDDVESGVPHPSSIVRAGVDAWMIHARALTPYRTGELLQLASFITNKDNANGLRDRTDRYRRGPAANSDAVGID